MPLDLDKGDEELADASPADRRRAARKAAAEGKSDTKDKPGGKSRSRAGGRAGVQDRVEVELASRLNRTFDRIALALESRGDEELANVVREDSDAMGQGLVSLTRSMKFLRSPLLMALNLIEPVLAFGRVGRILYVRLAERQADQQRARQQAEEERASASQAPAIA